MKTILIAVSTINGYIADVNGHYPWATLEDRNEFAKLYEQAGCIIIGRVTYDILKNRNPFPTPGRLCVVLTHDQTVKSDNPNIEFLTSPNAALKYLENKGFKQVLIGGGGKLNSSFLREDLVDEIVLTLEPSIISRGTPIFIPGNFEKNLKLIDVKKLNKSTIQLHYKVLK